MWPESEYHDGKEVPKMLIRADIIAGLYTRVLAVVIAVLFPTGIWKS
jgi:hypothetical protein